MVMLCPPVRDTLETSLCAIRLFPTARMSRTGGHSPTPRHIETLVLYKGPRTSRCR